MDVSTEPSTQEPSFAIFLEATNTTEVSITSDGNEGDDISFSTPLAPAKKRGRKKGATAYSSGDETALLDAIEEVVPCSEQEWENVVGRYNLLYAGRYDRTIRSLNGLRGRFRELAWGEPSGGGVRTPSQQRALEIMRKIDAKQGTLRSDGPRPQMKTPDQHSPSELSNEGTRGKGGANSKFRKQILEVAKRNTEMQEEMLAWEKKRHEDTMSILQEFLKKF